MRLEKKTITGKKITSHLLLKGVVVEVLEKVTSVRLFIWKARKEAEVLEMIMLYIVCQNGTLNTHYIICYITVGLVFVDPYIILEQHMWIVY